MLASRLMAQTGFQRRAQAAAVRYFSRSMAVREGDDLPYHLVSIPRDYKDPLAFLLWSNLTNPSSSCTLILYGTVLMKNDVIALTKLVSLRVVTFLLALRFHFCSAGGRHASTFTGE